MSTSWRRLPPQWRIGAPTWSWDRWGLARGGRSDAPFPPPTPRPIFWCNVCGWVLFWALMFAAYLFREGSLALLAFVSIPGALLARGIVRSRMG